jgi:hypothetical protein
MDRSRHCPDLDAKFPEFLQHELFITFRCTIDDQSCGAQKLVLAKNSEFLQTLFENCAKGIEELNISFHANHHFNRVIDVISEPRSEAILTASIESLIISFALAGF